MKYLKSYKILFESSEKSNIPEIYHEVKDALIPLSDRGYDIETSYIDSGDGIISLFIKLIGEKSLSTYRVPKEFHFSDIKEDLEFILNLLSNGGYINYTCIVKYVLDKYRPQLVLTNKLPDDDLEIITINLIIRK